MKRLADTCLGTATEPHDARTENQFRVDVTCRTNATLTP